MDRLVTLEQMLAAREARQARIAAAHYRAPLVSFTMNIAGPVKTSPLIRRGFEEGLRALTDVFAERSIPLSLLDQTDSVTGCEALFAAAGDPLEVKRLCAAVEDATPLGRLFDMDVIDRNGRKLDRNELGLEERGCIVCGAPGRGCAARRLHSIEELQQETNHRLTEYFFKVDRKTAETLAVDSLIAEVQVTPKPGLVDKANSGSHNDMDLPLFMKSATALAPYWSECFTIGAETAVLPPEETFARLREAGLAAEKTMFVATGGVNTHKGAIFLMGTLCGAIGRLWNCDHPFPAADNILDECKKMSESAMQADFVQIEKAIHLHTAGEAIYNTLRIRGARGEVADGFPHVRNVSLPALRRALARGLSEERAAAVALLHLIATVEDTNMIKRGAKKDLYNGGEWAEELIRDDRIPSTEEIEALDRKFIAENLSPGGCADLLAITLFLYHWEQMRGPQ